MKSPATKSKGILLILLFFEVALLTFWRGKAGVFASPVLLILFSLAIAVFPAWVMIKGSIQPNQTIAPRRLNLVPASLLFLVLSVSCFAWFRSIISINPIDYKVSDVIPTVDILSKRLLTGSFVYDVITNFGHDLPPTYMPLQWLPFVLSSALGFDHRWIAFGIWLTSVFLIYIYQIKHTPSQAILLINTALPFVVLMAFMYYFPSLFANTFELMLAGYYLLFGLSILSQSYVSKALGLSLTLLSRYATILFAPLYMLLLFLSKKKKEAVLISLITFFLIAAIYVIPFYMKQPSILTKGFSYYTEAAAGEWQPKEWQKPDDKPFQLFRGVGMACWFYQFYPCTLSDKLSASKLTHLLVSLLSLGIILMIFLKFRHRIEVSLFLLTSLKFYLTFFYGFIQVPYIYLQIVPVFISVLITICFLQNMFFHNQTLAINNDTF